MSSHLLKMRQTITEQNWNEFCCICSWAFHYCTLMGNWWGQVFFSFYRDNQNVMHSNTGLWKRLLLFTGRPNDLYWPLLTTLLLLLREEAASLSQFLLLSFLRLFWSLSYWDFCNLREELGQPTPDATTALSLAPVPDAASFLWPPFFQFCRQVILQRNNLTILPFRSWQSQGSSLLKSKITPEQTIRMSSFGQL